MPINPYPALAFPSVKNVIRILAAGELLAVADLKQLSWEFEEKFSANFRVKVILHISASFVEELFGNGEKTLAEKSKRYAVNWRRTTGCRGP